MLRRAAELEALVFAPSAPLDRALQAYQRRTRALGRNDRLVLGRAVYALARGRAALRAALPHARTGSGDLLLFALLDAQRASPAAIPELAGDPRRWEEALARLAGLRGEWLAAVETAREASPAASGREPAGAFGGLFGVPPWWLELGPWGTLGEAADELARLKRPQRLVLRAQAHRGSRAEALAALGELSIPCRPTERSPWGVVVEGRHNVLATEPYRSGLVEVQDEGSQLAACLCDPKPDEKVLDLCAGGGGKSLALGAMLGGRGRIVAHDADPRRLEDARRRARRSGLGNIQCVEDPAEVERLGPYQLVLVDAPCSSTGTLRRNPDVAWRWTREAVERLTEVQAAILDRAAGLVAPGGHLVYVTCSLLRVENEDRAEAFLARHPTFALEPLGDRRAHAPLLDVPGAATGAFRLPANLPRYAGDAFFLARFRKD